MEDPTANEVEEIDPYTRLITEMAALRGQLIAYAELVDVFEPAAAIDGIAMTLANHVPEAQLGPLLTDTEEMGRTMVLGGLQKSDPEEMLHAANEAMKLRIALEGTDMTKWRTEPE